jgi:hypothetical protein
MKLEAIQDEDMPSEAIQAEADISDDVSAIIANDDEDFPDVAQKIQVSML